MKRSVRVRLRSGRHVLATSLVFALALPAALGLRAQDDATPSDEQIRPYDIVIYKNASGNTERWRCNILGRGDSLEVEKIGEDGRVTLRIKLPMADVEEIIPRATAEDVYEVKVDRLPGVDQTEARARALLKLGLWCRTPLLENGGEAPRPDAAFEHLRQAVRVDPSLTQAYPYLLDELAERRIEGTLEPNTEMEIFLLAREAGYEHPEIEFRLGEIYLQAGREEKAREAFESVLAADGPPNRSLASRSRRYLAEIHLLRGEPQKALALFEDEGGDVFESRYLAARILLMDAPRQNRERARELLEEAREAQPEFPGVQLQLAALDLLEGKVQVAAGRLARTLSATGDDASFLTALALVDFEQGKFARARERLAQAEALVGESAAGEERARAQLVRGLLADSAGDRAAAVEAYRAAFDAAGASALSSLKLAAGLHLVRALVAAERAAEARGVLDGLVERWKEDREVFSAYARALADVEIASNRRQQALELLDHAVRHDPDDVALRVRHGTLLLHAGRLDAAYPHLARAKELEPERPDVNCALGYYHYSLGAVRDAEAAFRLALRRLPAKPTDGPGDAARRQFALRQYAERGLSQARDIRLLELWQDRFDRPNSDDLLQGWSKEDNLGVRVRIRDGRVVFEGEQKNEGVTKMFREEKPDNVEKISARLRIPASQPVRAGLRIEADPRDGGAGLVFMRDADGTMTFSYRTARSSWKDAEPATDKKPESGKLVFAGDVKWPDDGEFHTLTIRNADSSRGGKGFNLFLDERIVAHNVTVSGLSTRVRRPLQVGVSAQAESTGSAVRLEVDDFQIYRARPEVEEEKTR